MLRNSNHPLSRKIYDELNEVEVLELEHFHEFTGKGVEGKFNGDQVKAGSSSFVKAEKDPFNYDTSVHISFNDYYTGKYTIKNSYREGVREVFGALSPSCEVAILSGDNEGEKNFLNPITDTLVCMGCSQSF